MSSSFSIADILADVARTANVPAFSTTTNVSLASVTYRLVQSARSLSALFRQKLGEDQDFINQATLTVPAGVGLSSLPADCGEIHALLWVKSASDWRLLDAAALDDLEDGQLDDLKTWTDGRTPSYRLMGNTVSFYPASSAAETVVIFYTKHLNLTGETTFLSRVDADRWITLDLVIWVLNAQGRQTDSALFMQEKAMLEAQLFSSDRGRDPNAVSTIRDTRSRRFHAAARSRWGY